VKRERRNRKRSVEWKDAAGWWEDERGGETGGERRWDEAGGVMWGGRRPTNALTEPEEACRLHAFCSISVLCSTTWTCCARS